ncbi:MAG: hypothetical protein JSW34_07865 [Candidatus Zixiibacteriota bacterium]|nr:MAG: hypothetical protein JSW34_07865 [candidate division Zixibacteria bacterium]
MTPGRIISIFTLVAILAAPVDGVTETVECEILQYKLERLYFGAGQEELVFPGCRFAVVRGADTVYESTIEESYQGVSLSRPVFNFSDTLDLETCRALIQAATIDSQSVIQLGCFEHDPVTLMIPPPDDTGRFVAVTGGGNRVSVERTDQFALVAGYGYPKLDGYLSASPFPESVRYNRAVSSSAAPYVAVLLPNLSSRAYRDGFLSTSLYYRFDIARVFPVLVESDAPRPTYRLYTISGAAPRAYPFDPDRGRQLLKRWGSRSPEVTISVMNRLLEDVGRFFGDVLAQDRVPVRITYDDPGADLMVDFVPVDHDNPLISLEFIYARLVAGKPSSKTTKQHLAVIRGYLDGIREAADVATRYHYCRLADRSLQQDLGVFPLYRPSVHFLAGRELKGVQFDASGRLDVRALTKLRFPPEEAETSP